MLAQFVFIGKEDHKNVMEKNVIYRGNFSDKYRKSYKREGCFKSSQNLRTFKTSRVTINPEMHEPLHTIFYLYIQQDSSVALLLGVVRTRILQCLGLRLF